LTSQSFIQLNLGLGNFRLSFGLKQSPAACFDILVNQSVNQFSQ